jgi:predicted ATP-grasp superfamily ATP-dependent carboligase
VADEKGGNRKMIERSKLNGFNTSDDHVTKDDIEHKAAENVESINGLISASEVA